MNYKHELIHTFKYVNVNGLSGEEKKIKNRIIKYCKDNIVNVRFAEDKIGNLWIGLKGKGKGKLMFTTHLDVVGDIGTVEYSGGRLRIKEKSGYILGADSRAGISVILNTIKDLDVKSYKQIIVLFTIQEECGFIGIRHANLSSYKGVIISADRPVGRDNKGNIINVHFKKITKRNKNVDKMRVVAKNIKRKIVLHDAHHRNAYIGGDASFIIENDVFDFCCGSRSIHSSKESLSLKDFFHSYKVMVEFARKILK